VRSALFFCSLLVVTGCAGSGPAPVPGNQIRAEFPQGGVANQIEITAMDRLPLRTAELVAPDGRTTPASSIIANPAPTSTISSEFAGGVGSGPSYGVTSIGSNALTPNIVGTAPVTETKLLAILSTASIAVPDPEAYRRDWQRYRIRLGLGTPPQVETREIAAPPPRSAGG
jgi:hypothetical protein